MITYLCYVFKMFMRFLIYSRFMKIPSYSSIFLQENFTMVC